MNLPGLRCPHCGREFPNTAHVVAGCCEASILALAEAEEFVIRLRREALLYARAVRDLGIGR